VVEGREEGVGVWREVDTRGLGFEVQDGADERWILVRETVVFLATDIGLVRSHEE
jgi:hypothetical protein